MSPLCDAPVGEMPDTLARLRPGIFGVAESRLQLAGIATEALPDAIWPLACELDEDELPPVEWPTKNPIAPSTAAASTMPPMRSAAAGPRPSRAGAATRAGGGGAAG